MTKTISKSTVQILTAVGFAACLVALFYAWRGGLLTSQEAMANFVRSCGVWAPAVFVLFQIVQVVLPVLPGGLGCLVGVLLFGPWNGFVYNYFGICIGSMIAFSIARTWGRPLLPVLFSQQTIDKYDSWTKAGSPFAKWLAIAITLPAAPDDFLCYLAGTTKMSWRTFSTIIWLCKPFAIAAYSMGLVFLWDKLSLLF